MNRFWSLGVVVSLALLFTTACGSSGHTRVRFMNASPDVSSLDFLVDGNAIASNVAYGTASNYMSVSSGSRHVQVEPAGTSSFLIDQNSSFNSATDSTFIAANFSTSISALILTDDNSAPAAGNMKLRLVNAVPAIGPVDVYIVAPGTDINTVSPTISNLALFAESGYQSLPAGSYEAIFTVPGQKFVYIDSGSLTFTAGQIRTIVALNDQVRGYTMTVLSDVN
ncbi:MAG TPA: DUF4397 domain-containing protein [Terriglobales bacterium]